MSQSIHFKGTHIHRGTQIVNKKVQISNNDIRIPRKKKFEIINRKAATQPFLPFVRKSGKLAVIHVVYPVYPLPLKAYGGVERGVYLLAKEQAKRGCDVYVFAHPESKIPGCTIIPCLLDKNGGGREQSDRVLKFIQNNKPDVIHDHSPWGFLGKSNCKCPVIRTIYGDPYKRYQKTIRKDSFVTFTTSAFARFYGFPDAPIIRVSVGDNLDKVPFQIMERGDWALFIGKMEEIKGPHIAIEWAKKLNKTLVLFGPIFDRTFFDKKVRNRLDYTSGTIDNTICLAKNVPAGKIIYAGLITRKDIWKAYLAAGIVFVPSQCEEAMSRVVQEAMLTGCPVIATDRGGIFESMGEGIGGRVVNSTDEVVEHIETLFQWYDPRAAREHILNTRNPEVMADSCELIYKEMLG